MTPFLHAFAIVAAFLCIRASTLGEATPQSASRDVIDEESLRALARKASQQAAVHGPKTKPLVAPRPSTESSLLTSSILISDGDKFTIVPIGSVLHLPASLRSRVIARPQGDILMWPDFLQKNTAWITAKEVPLPVSRGEMKAPAALIREFSNEVRIVVAVYHGCPITILEPASNNEPQNHKAADRR
jgi:hypothetical protein